MVQAEGVVLHTFSLYYTACTSGVPQSVRYAFSLYCIPTNCAALSLYRVRMKIVVRLIWLQKFFLNSGKRVASQNPILRGCCY